MPSKKVVEGYHVKVEPYIGYSRYDVAEAKQICQSIIDQIKRHVDDVNYTELVEESHLECEFCGYKWSEDPDSPHNGGCCGKDADIMEQTENEVS